MAHESEHTRPISIADIDALVGVVTRIPRRWAIVVLVAALASTVEVSVKQGAVDGTFQISGITVGLVALVWLPALVKVIVLAGGAVKTPAGEASAGGLVDVLRSLAPESRREALPAVIAAIGTDPRKDDPILTRARHDLEDELAGLPVEAARARERLDELARQYEAVRESMSAGPERTFKMTQIVAEARGLAASAQLDPRSLTGLYTRARDGDRVVTLAAIQGRPDRQDFPIVIDSLKSAHSPFEQFHALATAQVLLPMLAPEQRRDLREAILGQMEAGAAGMKIDRRDPDRWNLANRLLQPLGLEPAARG